MGTEANDTKPARWGWEKSLILAIGVIAVVVLSLAGGFAFGFFLLAGLLVAGVAWFFYWVMVHQRVRNPMHPLRSTTAERWTDGQPLGRAVAHEEEIAEMERERHEYRAAAKAEVADDDHQAAEEAEHHDPADYEGPPPVNPFP